MYRSDRASLYLLIAILESRRPTRPRPGRAARRARAAGRGAGRDPRLGGGGGGRAAHTLSSAVPLWLRGIAMEPHPQRDRPHG